MKPLSGKQLATLLEHNGWTLQRVNGSHHIYTKPGFAVRLSIPIHGDKPLKPGLQSFLMKSAGII